MALLATARRLRRRRLVLPLGTFLFLAGYFIASNVANLEQAFEQIALPPDP